MVHATRVIQRQAKVNSAPCKSRSLLVNGHQIFTVCVQLAQVLQQARYVVVIDLVDHHRPQGIVQRCVGECEECNDAHYVCTTTFHT